MKTTKEHGYSEFWLDKANAYKKSEDPSMETLLNFAAIQDAISNFVKIVTGKNIPVRFNTKNNQSATDGRKVVVSADVSETNFDSTVGLSLHEASHILLSDFELLEQLTEHIPAPVHQAADKLGIKSTGLVATIVHRIMNVIEDRRIDYFMYKTAPGYRGYYNSMYNKYWHSPIVDEALKSGSYRNEDWDSYDYRIVNLSNPNTDLDALRGLREIAALIDLKNISRFKTSEEVLAVACDVAIIVFKNITLPKAPKKQPPIPGLSNKSTSSGSGSGSGKKDDKGELDENNMPNSGFSPEQSEEPTESEEEEKGKSDKDKESEDYKSDDKEGESDFEDDSEQKTDDEQEGDESKAGEKSDEEKADDEMKKGTTESDSEDAEKEKPEPDPLSKKDEEKAKAAHEKQVDFLNHDVEKEEMSEEMATNLEAVSQADASIEDVAFDYFGTDVRVPVVVIRNVNEEFYASDMCPFSAKSFNKEEDGVFIAGSYEEQVKQGITLGKLLGRHLQIRNDVKKHRIIRKQSGKIVRRLLHEAGMGNENVFGFTITEQFDKAEIHITIDISGSMSGTKLGQAILTVVAIAQFAAMTKNIGVVISVRYSEGSEDTPYIAVMYDSHTDKFSKVRRMFPHLIACGCTPEGLTFAAIEKEIVSSSKGVKSYFINFSDGAPMCTIHKDEQNISYANNPAAQHTRAQVKKLRNRGIKIKSFFIDTSHSYGVDCNAQFKTMYGKDAKTVTPGSLPELAKALEEMFLDKDSDN